MMDKIHECDEIDDINSTGLIHVSVEYDADIQTWLLFTRVQSTHEVPIVCCPFCRLDLSEEDHVG